MTFGSGPPRHDVNYDVDTNFPLADQIATPRVSPHLSLGGRADAMRKTVSHAVRVSTTSVHGSASTHTEAAKSRSSAWQSRVPQSRCRRCFFSIMFIMMRAVALLVAGSIAAVWVPSMWMAEQELKSASIEQQKNAVVQVSQELLNYMQVASSNAEVVRSVYDMSFATDPSTTPQVFLRRFGQGAWSIVKQAPTLSPLLLVQARSYDLINPTDPTCDLDAVFISAQYTANLNSNTTGTGFEDSPELRAEATDAAPAGKARFNLIHGNADLSDPLGYRALAFFVPCVSEIGRGQSGIGGGQSMWEAQSLPGSWSQKDTGIRGLMWQPGTLSAARLVPGSTALFKKVIFSLPGPPWANKSAFGTLAVKVSSDSSDAHGRTRSMSEILQQAASQTQKDALLFVMTGEGELLASSLPNQAVESRDEHGNVQGLVPADSEDLVVQPLQPVAKQLIGDHCRVDVDGRRTCAWSGMDDAQEIEGYYVAPYLLEDPIASNLNLLMVKMVSIDTVSTPAQELHEQVAFVSAIIFVVAVLLTLGLSRAITVPFRAARDSMFLLGDMRVEEALELNPPNGRGRCRWSFTEAADLRLSFYHAATCLKAWREREVERRELLEEDRTSRINKTVDKAVRGAGKLVHPMVLMGADAFTKMEQLTSYEELRNTANLVFLDTEEALASFRTRHSIIFLSHQWFAWGFPDNASKAHLNAMKGAVRCAAQRLGYAGGGGGRCAWDKLYVWVDYCSMAQDHRGMQMLAVSSLPVYASSADAFITIAPPAEHQSSGQRCDLQSGSSRGWCQAEMLAKMCSSGLQNFFIFGGGGTLEQVTEAQLPSLCMYVFEGEFSCCQQKHIKSSCVKEALVEPVLGLYSLVLRQVRAGVNLKYMEPVLKHIRHSKDRFFPPMYTFQAEGVQAEERELFGSLVEATEKYVQGISIEECAISFDSSDKKAADAGLASKPCGAGLATT